MDFGVAVGFGGGGDQEAGAVPAGQFEHVVGAAAELIMAICRGMRLKSAGEAGLARWNTASTGGRALISSVSSGRTISCSTSWKRRIVLQVGDVLRVAGEEVVNSGDGVALGKQGLAKMRADKARAAGDYDVQSKCLQVRD